MTNSPPDATVSLVTGCTGRLCHPMDCSLPGSSVHGIFQAIVLEWGAIAFSEGVINLFRLYCMVDITNIDILKLCKIPIDLICPDRIWLIIILVIILKCYLSQ